MWRKCDAVPCVGGQPTNEEVKDRRIDDLQQAMVVKHRGFMVVVAVFPPHHQPAQPHACSRQAAKVVSGGGQVSLAVVVVLRPPTQQ